MNITINAKAKQVIKSFSEREMGLYNYILELFKSDAKNFHDIDIARRAGDDPNKIREGASKVYAMHDRACYILQTLGLYANLNNSDLLIKTF